MYTRSSPVPSPLLTREHTTVGELSLKKEFIESVYFCQQIYQMLAEELSEAIYEGNEAWSEISNIREMHPKKSHPRKALNQTTFHPETIASKFYITPLSPFFLTSFLSYARLGLLCIDRHPHTLSPLSLSHTHTDVVMTHELMMS